MKPILYLALAAVGSACAPRILYLGEVYPSAQPHRVEVYFDEGQIAYPYQVIGSLANEDNGFFVTSQRVQQAMIEEAQAIGADAIVFHDMDVEHTEDAQYVILKAKAIRYQPGAKQR